VVTLREPAPEINQLVTVTLPGFSISGTFIVMRKEWRETGGKWLYELEFWESSFQKLALESLLRIVGAGKAVVSISANVFPNVQLFSTPGSGFTWVVPGGVTTAQFTCFGGGGGGGGAHRAFNTTSGCFCGNLVPTDGGAGGNGGKAVTILSTTPATTFDIIVGGGGAGGVNGDLFAPRCLPAQPTNGVDGGLSSATISAVVKCRGDAGTKGFKGNTSSAGASGTDGGGLGDAVSVGGGGAKGQKGVDCIQSPTGGGGGYVEVRW
jgi:hypothetical protein